MKQASVTVPITNGTPATSVLDDFLQRGYHVVSATPILIAIHRTAYGTQDLAAASATSAILYIVQTDRVL